MGSIRSEIIREIAPAMPEDASRAQVPCTQTEELGAVAPTALLRKPC
jgi:hypothetical protein